MGSYNNFKFLTSALISEVFRCAIFSACLIVFSALSAIAEIAPSENCQNRSQTIAPGTYTGEWEMECKLQGGPQHLNFALVLHMKGDLKLTVGEDERLISAESAFTSSFGGEGNAAGIPATSTQDGTGHLNLLKDTGKKTTTPSSFTMSGSGQAEGALTVAGHSDPKSGGGGFEGRFKLNTKDCGVFGGDLRSQMLTEQMDAMRAAGYNVVWTNPGSWQVKVEGEDTFAVRRQELRKELEQAQQTAQNIIYRREGESKKLGAALEKIKKEKEPLKSCLFDDWLEWVKLRVEKWVDEDTASLKGTHRNTSLYREHMLRLLSTLRQFALLGLDECRANLQEKAWKALQDEVEARLKLLVDQAAGAEDVLAEARNAALLGVTSPQERERVLAYIKDTALQFYKVERANWLQLYNAEKAQPPSDAETLAYKRAVCAKKDYLLVGGDKIEDGLEDNFLRYGWTSSY